MRLAAILVALALAAACASYRVLPPDAVGERVAALPMRAQATRFGIFHSSAEATIDRVFADPADSANVLLTTWQPEAGVLATSDGGKSWQYTGLGVDHAAPLGTVVFAPGAIVATSGGRLLRSTDGGGAWATTPVKGPVEALVSAGGRLYAQAGATLSESADGGVTWQSFPLPAARIHSLAADPDRPGVLFLSASGEPAPFRAAAVLDETSTEALAAFALIDAQDASAPSFGRGARGFVSLDGGRTWQPTALALEAQLVARRGALYALGDDPMLVAAGLVRQNPGLASAVALQFHGLRVDSVAVRAATGWPGLQRVLEGDIAGMPVFESHDDGATFHRILPGSQLQVELRLALEAQRRAVPEAAPEQQPRRGRQDPPQRDLEQSRRGGRGGGGQRRPQQPPQPRAPDRSGAVLAFLDPVRLLSRAAFDSPLSGVSRAGDGTLFAWAPREELWEKIADGVARATEGAGELAMLPDWSLADLAPEAGFALLRSTDGGSSWIEEPLPRDPAPPSSPGLTFAPVQLAAAPSQLYLLLAGHDRRAQTWQRLLRVAR